MHISFGKFIPVKVFVDGKEVKPNKEGAMPKEISKVTLTLCDCLSKNKNYPNSYLAEQQRRYFASQIHDYKVPEKPAQNKSKILPSSVKTANIDGQRYLITGDDIYVYSEEGHNLGTKTKDSLEKTQQALSSAYEGMSSDDFNKKVKAVMNTETKILKQDRVNAIKQYMRRNDRVSDKTIYIHAITNDKAKLERDKYKIALIDFKA